MSSLPFLGSGLAAHMSPLLGHIQRSVQVFLLPISAAPLTSRHARGNLQLALELYRKAETYVPDNVKLKERWVLFIVISV